MAGINKVILVGNLGKDPEVRTVQSGIQVARITLATSEAYTNKEGQRIEQTEWHNVILWRGLANIAEKYLKKGNKVYIEGKLKTRSYDDKDGVKRYVTEIEASDLLLLDKAPAGGGTYSGTSTSGVQNETTYNGGVQSGENTPADNDDLPF